MWKVRDIQIEKDYYVFIAGGYDQDPRNMGKF